MLVVEAVSNDEVAAPIGRGVAWLWPGALGLSVVAALGFAEGGYFPTSWGWATVPLAWFSATVLVVARPVLGRGQLALLGAWVALVGWTALSAFWSIDVPKSAFEVERDLLYLAVVLAVALVPGARAARQMLGGLLIAIAGVSLFGLASRLFPTVIDVSGPNPNNRLAEPIGYWNGLAIFSAMGMLLALGFAIHGARLATRAAAGALLVPLGATFYYTFGRLGWLALFVALVVTAAVDRRRSALLGTLALLGPVVALGMWRAASSSALTHLGSPLARQVSDGRAVALVLALLGCCAAVLTVIREPLARRLPRSPVDGRVATGITVLLVVVVLAGAVVRAGGPSDVASKAWNSFKSDKSKPIDLNSRLVDLSGNGRYQLWQFAWSDVKSHPVLGSGAGSYERWFLARQPPYTEQVRDAHGLYIQTLAELGPAGLALLVVALALPLVAGARRRSEPLLAVAYAAYLGFLIHAASDWDWQLPAVTIAALICGGVLLRRDGTDAPPLRRPAWAGALLVTVAIAVLGGFALIGNSAVSASNSARGSGDLERAASQARRAEAWMPWSPEPWVALGLAERQAGLVSAARASFTHAISIDSGNWKIWGYLASVTRGPERIRALRKAQVLYPVSPLEKVP